MSEGRSPDQSPEGQEFSSAGKQKKTPDQRTSTRRAFVTAGLSTAFAGLLTRVGRGGNQRASQPATPEPTPTPTERPRNIASLETLDLSHEDVDLSELSRSGLTFVRIKEDGTLRRTPKPDLLVLKLVPKKIDLDPDSPEVVIVREGLDDRVDNGKNYTSSELREEMNGTDGIFLCAEGGTYNSEKFGNLQSTTDPNKRVGLWYPKANVMKNENGGWRAVLANLNGSPREKGQEPLAVSATFGTVTRTIPQQQANILSAQ
ncbi:MAG: hypothetical protein HYV40_02860 [Candidatus Levybacteria bacterium]|nr:hypothetical protein [Candidatus Levybacteria bacterium]